MSELSQIITSLSKIEDTQNLALVLLFILLFLLIKAKSINRVIDVLSENFNILAKSGVMGLAIIAGFGLAVTIESAVAIVLSFIFAFAAYRTGLAQLGDQWDSQTSGE